MVYSAAVGVILIFLDILLLEALRIRFIVCFRRCRNLEKAIMILRQKEEGIGELKNLSAHFNIMADKLQEQMEENPKERTRASADGEEVAAVSD